MKYFEVGKIVNTHGLQGLVRVISYSDDPERFFNLNKVIVSKNDNNTEMRIVRAYKHKQFIILKLKGIEHIDDALDLKESVLKIPESQGLPLEQDEYYIRDIYDMRVYEENGEFLGEVKDIIFTGANDVYIIKSEGKKDLLIPAIKQCIKKVDLENKRITVCLMEGLRD